MVKLDKLVETLKTNISNAYSVAAATLDDSKSAAKNDEIYLRPSQLDRLHKAMQEKLVICTISDACSRKYCTKCLSVSEYLVWTARELKKVDGILAKPSSKRGKKIHKKQLTSLLTFFRVMNLVAKWPLKRTVPVFEIRSKSKNAWYYATCMKYMLHLRKKSKS